MTDILGACDLPHRLVVVPPLYRLLGLDSDVAISHWRFLRQTYETKKLFPFNDFVFAHNSDFWHHAERPLSG